MVLHWTRFYSHSKYDRWFLERIQNLVQHEEAIRKQGLPKTFSGWMQLKQLGFSDFRLAELSSKKVEDVVRLRLKMGVTPVFKRIDTCAAEFSSRCLICTRRMRRTVYN